MSDGYEVDWKDQFMMESKRAEKAEAQVDQLLRFINGAGMSDHLKAFCVKEASK